MRSVASNFSLLSCSYAPRRLSHSSGRNVAMKVSEEILYTQFVDFASDWAATVWKELPHPRLNSLHYSKLEPEGHDAVKHITELKSKRFCPQICRWGWKRWCSAAKQKQSMHAVSFLFYCERPNLAFDVLANCTLHIFTHSELLK